MNEIGRIVANAYYDFQGVRISIMNKIRDIIRKKTEGIKFDEVEEKKEEKKKTKKYADDMLLKKWGVLLNKNEITQKEYDYLLECWEAAKESKKIETQYRKSMLSFVEQDPLYQKFLCNVRGIGAVLSANLIKEFGDCSGYDTVSKLWAHCGLSVVDGKAPRRSKGKTIKYSPRLKTLTWKISDSLLKQNKGYYRGIYDSEKDKQLNKEYEEKYLFEKYGKPYKEGDTRLQLGHAHNRALRKMRKIFLDHMWHCAREIVGLEAKKNYVEGVLGHTHIVSWEEALVLESNGKE